MVFFLWFVFGFSFMFHFWAALQGWWMPAESFRASQTALSAYFIQKGGPLFGYELPIFGPPWSAPLEFPLYQWLVAGLSKCFDFPLEQTGRAISLASFYLCLLPLWRGLNHFHVEKNYKLIFLSLFLISPIYIVYSRDFLIEMFVVLLGVTYLSFVLDSVYLRKIQYLFFACVFGVFCALVKVTTFVAVLYGAGFICVFEIGKRIFNKKRLEYKEYIKWFVCFAFIPLTIVFYWTHYADTLKSNNPYSMVFSSKNLNQWHFGTLEDRLQFFDLFCRFFFRSSLTDALGQRAVAFPILFSFFIIRTHWKHFVAFLLVYLAILWTFPTLYTRTGHHYYKVGSLYYMIIAFGFVFYSWIKQKTYLRWVGLAVFVLTIGGAVSEYFREYINMQRTGDDLLTRFSKRIQEVTSEESVLIIIGHGTNSSIPFQSRRRALMTSGTESINSPNMKYILGNLVPYEIGGIVVCDQDGLKAVQKYQDKFSYFKFKDTPAFPIDERVADQQKYNCFFFNKKVY